MCASPCLAMEEQELLVELEGLIKDDAHEAALATCERLLVISPNDQDIMRAKLVCQVELGSYADALQHLDLHPQIAGDGFERAYCLYSLNREQEALAALPASPAGPNALLAAQIQYRLGSHGEAARLFAEASKDEQGSPSAETSTNIIAALTSAGRAAEAVEYASQLPATTQFEHFYNRACAEIDMGELSAAKRSLHTALTQCRESLPTDEYTEEEIEVELGVLTAQAAFVDQQRGDTDAASTAYKLLFGFKTELDPAVAAVAANNIVALRGGQRDLFDSWKKCRANLAESLAKKLTPRQRRAFLFNGAVLSMHMAKSDQSKELIAALQKEFPNSADAALVQASIAMRSKQPVQCEQLLKTAAATTDDARIALSLAQLQLQAKQPELALKTLESIESLRSTPAMVGTLVALHERLGDIDGAAAALEACGNPKLLQSASAFYARHGRWREAAAAQQRLVDAEPRNLQALAGLVVSLSHFDPDAANTQLAKLEMISPPLDLDSEELDAEQLEQANLPRAAKRVFDGRKRVVDEGVPSERQPRKRHRSRKKPHYPKGFDPANPGPPPDPERWLPKRERSNYRPRKKDKRGGLSRGPQGSTAGQARPDARATTNVKAISEEEKQRLKREEEAKGRAEAAAAAAAAAASGSKKKGGGKAKAKGKW